MTLPTLPYDAETLIETHETWLDYYLDAWVTAAENGSHGSAERSLATAAQHAAILTALRTRSAQEGDKG